MTIVGRNCDYERLPGKHLFREMGDSVQVTQLCPFSGFSDFTYCSVTVREMVGVVIRRQFEKRTNHRCQKAAVGNHRHPFIRFAVSCFRLMNERAGIAVGALEHQFDVPPIPKTASLHP